MPTKRKRKQNALERSETFSTRSLCNHRCDLSSGSKVKPSSNPFRYPLNLRRVAFSQAPKAFLCFRLRQSTAIRSGGRFNRKEPKMVPTANFFMPAHRFPLLQRTSEQNPALGGDGQRLSPKAKSSRNNVFGKSRGRPLVQISAQASGLFSCSL